MPNKINISIPSLVVTLQKKREVGRVTLLQKCDQPITFLY